MPKEVFISYSSLDRDWAEQICKVLEINKISYWIAPDCIPGGSNYTTEIPLGIKRCVVFMLLVTNNSVQSPWVRKELDTAITEKKLIIPFIVDGTELTPDFSFLLNGVQHYSTASATDPTSAILSRISAEIRIAREKDPCSVPPEQPKHICPRCGFENINDDYKHIEKSAYEQIRDVYKNFWMYFIPFLTASVIYFIQLIKDGNAGKYILLCGIVMTFLQVYFKLFLIYRPIFIKKSNLRRGIIVKHVSCCRCGHRFRLNLPADEYVFNQFHN